MNIKRLLRQIIFIILISLIGGFGTNFSLIKKHFQGEFRKSFITAEEYPSITFITIVEAEELFAKGEALFIDSCPKLTYQDGHISGAINIPYEEFKKKGSRNQLSFLDEKTLVVYCDEEECKSSIAVAKILHQWGFKNIKVFGGGWAEWVREGLPVTSENDSQ